MEFLAWGRPLGGRNNNTSLQGKSKALQQITDQTGPGSEID